MSALDPADLRILSPIIAAPHEAKAAVFAQSHLSSMQRKLLAAREWLRARSHEHPRWICKRLTPRTDQGTD